MVAGHRTVSGSLCLYDIDDVTAKRPLNDKQSVAVDSLVRPSDAERAVAEVFVSCLLISSKSTNNTSSTN